MGRAGTTARRLGWTFGLAVAVTVGLQVRAEPVLFLGDDTYFVVWTLDLSDGTVPRGFNLPPEAIPRVPGARSGLAFDGTSLYYTHSATRTVWALNPEDGAVLHRFPKPALALSGLAAANGVVYAVSEGTVQQRNRTIFALDPEDGAVLAQRRIPGAMEALTASAATGSLFVAVGSFEIRELDLETLQTRRSLAAPGDVVGLAMSPRGDALFASTLEGALQEIDLEGAFVRRIDPVDDFGREILRVGSLASGIIGIIDTTDPPPPDQRVFRPVFDIQDVSITAGTEVNVPLLLTADRPIEAFEVGVAHDPSVLRLAAVTIDGTASARAGADFSTSEITSNGGTLSVVLDLEPPFQGNTLGAGRNQVVGLLRYGCDDVDSIRTVETELRVVNGLVGSPPKSVSVVNRGNTFPAEARPGLVTCFPRAIDDEGPAFTCGARDEDGLMVQASGRTGEQVELCFFYQFPDPDGDLIQAVSMGLTFDCRLECIENSFTVPLISILEEIEADFVDFNCDNDPDDGDSCEMVFAVLVDSMPPFGDASLPPADAPRLLACVDLEIPEDAMQGECLEVSFQDNVNGRQPVPVRNIVTLENVSIPPMTESCSICVTGVGPSLFCGNATLDAEGLPTPLSGARGDEVELSFWYRSPGEPVRAFTQALRFDCALECVGGLSVPFDSALSSLDDAEMVRFDCDVDQGDGDGCELVLDIVLSSGPGGSVLPATNVPLRTVTTRMRIGESAPGGVCLDLEHQDGIDGADGITVNNRITTVRGPVNPQTNNCEICVQPDAPPMFFCGGTELGPDGLPAPIEEVRVGQRTELCFWYASPIDEGSEFDEIQGLSMALQFECELNCFEDSFRLPPDSAALGVNAEFVEFNCDNDPHDGDGCEMIFGLVVDVLPPIEGRTLPPTNTPLKLACVDMEIDPTAQEGVCYDVFFRDRVDGTSVVPVKNLVSIKSRSFEPATSDCEVCGSGMAPGFTCGGPGVSVTGEVPAAEGTSGSLAEVCFWYSSPDPLQGLVMAIEYDCEITCLEDTFRTPEDSISAAIEIDFLEIECDNDPDDGDGCELILGLLVDALPPFDGRTLPPTEEPLKLGCLDFLLPEAPCDTCFSLRFQNLIDGPNVVPIKNRVSIDNRTFRARLADCEICITRDSDPVFKRGDCNFDEWVDIADPAEIISSLFGIGAWKANPPCLDACDANDDGRLDLADSFAVLYYIFTNGPPPPPPGPETAGVDPTEDKIDCGVGQCADEE